MHILTCAPPGWRASTLHVGRGAAEHADCWRAPAFALVDERVAALHQVAALTDCPHLTLPGGEPTKSLGTLERVLRAIAGLPLPRAGRVIALGGGAIGDLGGLAAALYMRGVELVQIPTTLLAMVDASVGGKTAVNLPEGKNLVGAFWPASHVAIDPGFLATLPDDEFASGLGEVLKVAIGLDAALFELLERERDAVAARDPAILTEVITRAVRAKIRIVERDPGEAGPRRLLNLGHTLGHALEAHSEWRVAHGHAVARGLHYAIDVAAARDLLAPAPAQRCRALLAAYGFTADPLPPGDQLQPFLARDKKVVGQHVELVLPTDIGTCRCVPTPLADL